MEATVTDNRERSRYELTLDGEPAGWIDYVRGDGVLTMTHAEIRRDLRNRGLGETLVRDALADVRAHGAKVRPVCPFVAAYVRRHDETHDLVVE